MKHMDQTNEFLDYMQNRVLNTLKTVLPLVPKDKINFKPEGELNSLKFLLYHVVNSPFIYLSGIGKKEFSDEDFKKISIDLESISDLKDLGDYYNTFSNFVDYLKGNIKNQYLDEAISYNLDKVGWGSWTLSGQRALETSFEEMIHHRGQIYIYLRMLGIKPPLIYPYL